MSAPAKPLLLQRAGTDVALDQVLRRQDPDDPDIAQSPNSGRRSGAVSATPRPPPPPSVSTTTDPSGQTTTSARRGPRRSFVAFADEASTSQSRILPATTTILPDVAEDRSGTTSSNQPSQPGVTYLGATTHAAAVESFSQSTASFSKSPPPGMSAQQYRARLLQDVTTVHAVISGETSASGRAPSTSSGNRSLDVLRAWLGEYGVPEFAIQALLSLRGDSSDVEGEREGSFPSSSKAGSTSPLIPTDEAEPDPAAPPGRYASVYANPARSEAAISSVAQQLALLVATRIAHQQHRPLVEPPKAALPSSMRGAQPAAGSERGLVVDAAEEHHQRVVTDDDESPHVRGPPGRSTAGTDAADSSSSPNAAPRTVAGGLRCSTVATTYGPPPNATTSTELPSATDSVELAGPLTPAATTPSTAERHHLSDVPYKADHDTDNGGTTDDDDMDEEAERRCESAPPVRRSTLPTPMARTLDDAVPSPTQAIVPVRSEHDADWRMDADLPSKSTAGASMSTKRPGSTAADASTHPFAASQSAPSASDPAIEALTGLLRHLLLDYHSSAASSPIMTTASSSAAIAVSGAGNNNHTNASGGTTTAMPPVAHGLPPRTTSWRSVAPPTPVNAAGNGGASRPHPPQSSVPFRRPSAAFSASGHQLQLHASFEHDELPRANTMPSPAFEAIISPGGRMNPNADVDLDDELLPSAVRRRMSVHLRGAIQSARRISLRFRSPEPAVSPSMTRTPASVFSHHSDPDDDTDSAAGGNDDSANNAHHQMYNTRHTHEVILAQDTSNPHDETFTINHYVILDTVGAGKQGEVYQAYDTAANAIRAIKAVKRPPTYDVISPPSRARGLSALDNPTAGANGDGAPVAEGAGEPALRQRSASTDSLAEQPDSPRPDVEAEGGLPDLVAEMYEEDDDINGGVTSDDATAAPNAAGSNSLLLSGGSISRQLECSPRAAGAAISIARLRARHSQFNRELSITEKCQYKHTVRLHEVINDPAHEMVYLVMDFFQGGAIASIRSDGSLPEALGIWNVATCGLHVACALQHMHSLGFVHRDVKPDNIFFRSYNGSDEELDDSGHSAAAAGTTAAAAGTAPGHAQGDDGATGGAGTDDESPRPHRQARRPHRASTTAAPRRVTAAVLRSYMPRGAYVLGDFGMAEEMLPVVASSLPHPPSGGFPGHSAANSESPDRAIEEDHNDYLSPERSQPTRGTFTFLSPEQLASSSNTPPNALINAAVVVSKKGPFRPTPAMDVWALGVTLYVLLEGKLPWTVAGVPISDIIEQILTAPIIFGNAAATTGSSPLESGSPEAHEILLREAVRKCVRGMLQRDPAHRWTTGRVTHTLRTAMSAAATAASAPARDSNSPPRLPQASPRMNRPARNN